MTTKKADRTRQLRKIFARPIVLVLVAIELLYVLASGIFLNAGFLPKLINTGPDDLDIHYSFAFSPFPAFVYARNANFRIQDHNVQLFGNIRNTYILVSPSNLFKRQFLAHYLGGSGMKFLFRLRRKPADMKKINLEALPEIPGLKDLAKPLHRKPPDPEADKRAWRVRMNHVSISNLEEIWFDRYHFLGKASVHGGFFVRPSHEVEVFPATLKISKGSLIGNDSLSLEKISTDIHFRLEHADTTDGQEEPLAPKISADVKIQSQLKTLLS